MGEHRFQMGGPGTTGPPLATALPGVREPLRDPIFGLRGLRMRFNGLMGFENISITATMIEA